MVTFYTKVFHRNASRTKNEYYIIRKLKALKCPFLCEIDVYAVFAPKKGVKEGAGITRPCG